MTIARRSRRIAAQSVVAGVGLSLVAMGFVAVGTIAPLVGAVLQEVIDVAVIVNALRALRVPLILAAPIALVSACRRGAAGPWRTASMKWLDDDPTQGGRHAERALALR